MNIVADNASVAAGVVSGNITVNNNSGGDSSCKVQLANTGSYPDGCEVHTVAMGSHIRVNNAYIMMAAFCTIEGDNNRVRFGDNITFIGNGNTIHDEV